MKSKTKKQSVGTLTLLTIFLSCLSSAPFFITDKLSKIPLFAALNFGIDWNVLAVAFGLFLFYLFCVVLFNKKDFAGFDLVDYLQHDDILDLRDTFTTLLKNELNDFSIDDKNFRKEFDPRLSSEKDYDTFLQKRLTEFVENLSLKFDLISAASRELKAEKISYVFKRRLLVRLPPKMMLF